MELIQVKQHILDSGHRYTGWGYFRGASFIPHACGKKYYSDFYAYGNFHDGIINGPALISHDYYMYTMHCKNDRGNGWGLCINRGILSEFGYYQDSQLKVDLTDFAHWYFTKMQKSERDDNMLNMYTYNESHEVADLFIGFKGTPVQNGIGLVFMGFHFTSDSSVWMGNTATRRYTGKLVHFRPDGKIDAGRFDNGNLVDRMTLQEIINDYYGTHDFSEDDLFADMFTPLREPNPIREQFRNIMEIEPNKCYFTGFTQMGNSQSKNKFTMAYNVTQVSTNGGYNFDDVAEERWVIGDKYIETPHGVLEVADAIFVEEGPLVGVQFTVDGILRISELGCDKDVNIRIFALMRQPNNAWVWVYAFDEFNNQVVNFCGFDDLDGMAAFIPVLKSVYK